MKLISHVRDHLSLPPLALTIGNFDGVHLGHQALIAHLKRAAKERQLKTGIVLFEPQPLEFLKKTAAPARLDSLRDKLMMFAKLGIDYVMIQRFTSRFSLMDPEAFIHDYLLSGLHLAYLLVGEDFRFGCHRLGGYDLLQDNAALLGFEVESVPDISIQGVRVSSTEIRQALQIGNFAKAQELLGRPYTMSGRVIHGDKRGRVLGCPTANIRMHRRVSPLQGVYVARVHGLGEQPLPAVVSLGYRPVFQGKELLLEVHLLNFQQEIYGQRLTVEFLHKLRDEMNFAKVELLVAQIQQDVEAARAFFGPSPYPLPQAGEGIRS